MHLIAAWCCPPFWVVKYSKISDSEDSVFVIIDR